jgi:hypothetical protein
MGVRMAFCFAQSGNDKSSKSESINYPEGTPPGVLQDQCLFKRWLVSPGRAHLLFYLLFLLVVGYQPARAITLSWDAVTNSPVSGYSLYRGTASRTYSVSNNVGLTTTCTVTGLVAGTTYYFSVTAFGATGLQSDYSAEMSYTVPITNSPPVTNTPPAIVLSSPANGASYTSPAQMTMGAAVTPNGHSVAKVQFYSGQTLVGESFSAPYSVLWTNVSAGSYSLKARLAYDATNTMDSSTTAISVAVPTPPPPPPAITNLPLPWVTATIGTLNLPSSVLSSSNLFTLTSAGNTGSTADNFGFVYQSLSADGEIRARIVSISNAVAASRTGVMIRESLAANSKNAFMGVSSSGSYRAQRRSSTGGNTSSTTSGSGTVPNLWVRLVRSGNTVSSYKSPDGVTWTKVTSRTLSMTTNIYAGLVTASGTSTNATTATFDHVTVVP